MSGAMYRRSAGCELRKASCGAASALHPCESAQRRALHAQAKGAPAQRDTGALLVDALMLLGRYDEAHAAAAPLRKTKVAAGVRLDLELDWLDASGERGDDVETEWDELSKNARVTHPWKPRSRSFRRAILERRFKGAEILLSWIVE